jgi:hypothetical protein
MERGMTAGTDDSVYQFPNEESWAPEPPAEIWGDPYSSDPYFPDPYA